MKDSSTRDYGLSSCAAIQPRCVFCDEVADLAVLRSSLLVASHSFS